MSTISNILKSFLTQNILGYIGVTLILIVICLFEILIHSLSLKAFKSMRIF